MGTVKYTGPVASFHCPTSADIRSLKVHFSPKQEGTGDPSPENVRPIVGWDGVEAYKTGKNLIGIDNDNYSCPFSSVVSGGTIPSDFIFENGEFSGTAPQGTRDLSVFTSNRAYPPGTYTLSYDYENNAINANWRPIVIAVGNKGSNWYSSATNGAYSGVSGKGHFVKTFTAVTPVYFNLSLNNYGNAETTAKNRIYNIKLEYASTATPFEPYRGDTINYTFGVLGKNKLNNNSNFWEIGSMNASGEKDNRTTRIRTIDFINVLPNTTYTISISSGYSFAWDEFYSGTHKYYYSWQSGSYTFTTHSDVNQLFFIIKKDDTTDITPSILENDCHIQLELSSTATAYEPYDPNHTVYGGWVDLVSGEAVKTWAVRPISQMSVTKTNGTGVWQHRFDLRAPWITGVGYEDAGGKYKAICSIFSFGTAETNFTYHTYAGLIDVYDDTTETAEDFQTKYGDYTVAYNIRSELYEHYQLPPYSSELKTFLSTNNVWSNADYVEVEYDLHETQDILARKQFIMASQPHVEEASGAIATFNTDMASPLKECKIHFAPVQEGTDDPSPENVRPITGWTGVEVYRTGKNMLDTATSDEIMENWPLVRPAYQKSIEKLPTNLDFTLQANVTKDLGQNISNCRLYMNGALISGKFINTATPLGVHTVTNKPNADGVFTIAHNYLGFDSYGATFNNMQLELGTTATDYEPYSGATIPIDWSDSGTIYGGYVDLVKGEVVAEQKIIDLGSIYWTQRYAGGAYIPGLFYSGVISDKGAGGISLVCDRYPYQYNSKIDQTADKTINDSYQTRLQCVNIRDSDYNEYSATEFKTAMSGVKCVYVLAEPIHYPIDPITLKTLRGTNNIWSNANGNIELSYWKH